ncbi:tail fiber domain-containing protein [Streptococcus oralis]|uniref:tail fiber domain-containing protein n=1 Tax=Streptococcus oralis TaxID=1303 RepID=UPI0022842DFD|nr:tail fiber domain-containing protein [Streptococcus oralis]MCY7080091.1 tail fiber domain-containing protein [Streptococcus oralis]
MDIFRRKKFDEAMFAKNRTLAIRVGQYQSSDIKEANFDYGYIKGDTYKPGGTCAGSGKITFTSIITTFNKLDKIYPEIGLLVDGTYEWVKMGEYFINDIEIDRNRNTTTLDLMDGMFKLNREHVTDLTYPAEIRHVIKEICLKTGVELANENMDIASMNYVIETKPKEKKMTFRDVLSLATQMLGMSCFFNREGKLEIKELTDSGITITADSYFMHGLTKSEVQYQIAGITCKKDKETLTVGMRTGRSLELDNVFMTQSALNDLYYKLKNLTYYPYNLNYQGHLLLNVGEWVTIKTNTGETFKSPVLSQSFTFKGGLRGRISADSKAGNDAQYSYAGTLTKKIEQFSEFEKQIQNQIEEADKGFDKKVEKIKNDFNDQVELAKARAEEVKQELSDTIDQRFSSFDNASIQEAKRKAEEALQKVGANTLLAQEAKRISEQLRRQLDNKADLVEFQRVKETNQLYERIIGRSESDIAEKVARMALTNQLFQVEVGKYANVGGPNMLRNSRADDGLKYWTEADGRLGFTAHTFYFNGQKRMFELRPGAIVKSSRFIIKRNTDYTLNILGFDNNSKYFRVYVSKRVKGSVSDYQERLLIFNGQPKWVNGPVLDNTKTTKKSITFNVGEYDECYLQFEYDRNNPNKWGGLFMTELDFYEGTTDRKWQPAPEDATMETDKTLEATQTKLSLLQGSFAFQNLTSAGAIISQINATNNQILIEAEKIRLKGKTLLDEITAIDGYFKRLFVGEGNFAKLNAEIIGSKTITADKLIMDSAMARLFVSSDIFTDTLASKAAFITKLRSVVVSATLLEGYKGKIGGFQIGTHDKDPHTYWLTGQNQFFVGMSNGAGDWGKTALWVNWGTTWDTPGDYAWFVKESGEMFCYNRAYFWNTPVINGDLRVTGDIYYKNENSGKSGYWIHSSKYSNFEPSNNYLYLYYSGSGYDWIPMNKEISDRRYKHNIEASTVSGLDVIEQLKTYSYRKEYDGKIEDIACGIMAQDVQKYAPEAFYENPDGAYSYKTFALVPYLIKAIQELNQKIQKLEKTA